MKAMILAAGRGTRMWPLSLLRAKPALPVLNRPLLHHTLELLKRHGVRDVLVNLHHLPATVTEALAPVAGLKVTYSRERQLLGTGGGPRKVAEAFGDAPFFLVNGDMVCDVDLSLLLARHREAGALATMALLPNPDPRYYGPVVTDPRGNVVSLPGTSKKRRGRVSLFAGIHVVEPRLLHVLRPGPSDIVRDLYAPLIEAGATSSGCGRRRRGGISGRPGTTSRRRGSCCGGAPGGASGFTRPRRSMAAQSFETRYWAPESRSAMALGSWEASSGPEPKWELERG